MSIFRPFEKHRPHFIAKLQKAIPRKLSKHDTFPRLRRDRCTRRRPTEKPFRLRHVRSRRHRTGQDKGRNRTTQPAPLARERAGTKIPPRRRGIRPEERAGKGEAEERKERDREKGRTTGERKKERGQEKGTERTEAIKRGRETPGQRFDAPALSGPVSLDGGAACDAGTKEDSSGGMFRTGAHTANGRGRTLRTGRSIRPYRYRRRP